MVFAPDIRRPAFLPAKYDASAHTDAIHENSLTVFRRIAHVRAVLEFLRKSLRLFVQQMPCVIRFVTTDL
jgi:hypothetical protein